MDYSVETSKSNERRNELLSSIYKFIVDICVEIYKKRFYIASGKTYVVSKEERNKVINIYNTYTPKLKSLNPDYIISPLKVRYGCYIATCVYGSYDCREVWTLRRYRDYKLAESWYGRLFISIYYKVSPILVKYFGKYKWFKKIWKNKLDKMVSKLQDKGYEDTPYIDRDWNK